MMRRMEVNEVPDSHDQEIAQLVHRVGVDTITIHRLDGSYVSYERVDDGESYPVNNCPDCLGGMMWNERLLDYVHTDRDKAEGCWLFRRQRREGRVS